MPIKKDTKNFIEQSISIYGDRFDYSKSIYTLYNEKLIIICKLHGDFMCAPQRHFSAKARKSYTGGCPGCHPNANMGQQVFIDRCNVLFDYEYDYSKVEYKNLRTKITIICHEHGIFFQKALSHLQGNGCQDCGNEQKKLSFNEFIIRANERHNNKYTYVPFINHNKIISIICPEHGTFEQNIFNHLNGRGCIKCFFDIIKDDTNSFIEKATLAHGNRYEYTKTNYTNSLTEVVIVCKDHGEFLQLPAHHIRGSGCPACAKVISKIETEWLDSLYVPISFRHIRIKIGDKFFKPDGIDIANKIVYEFYGDFWHGNPYKYDSNKINPATNTTFGELYAKTMSKEAYLKDNGYDVISIWESDYNANKTSK